MTPQPQQSIQKRRRGADHFGYGHQVALGKNKEGTGIWHSHGKHYHKPNTFWCGNWGDRTPEELIRECETTMEDLKIYFPELFRSRPAPAPEKPCLTCRVPQMNNGGCCLDETNCIDIANWERASDPYKVAEHDAAVAAQAREKVLLTLIERIEERKIAKWGESERDAIFRSIESLREAQR